MTAVGSEPRSESISSVIGSRIDDRYRVDAVLGRGAMGAVYRVHDEPTGRVLALKSFQLDPFRGSRHRRAELWFRREFHTIARLRHPCIVEVYDFGTDRGQPYYTMELLDGADLRDHEKLELPAACRIFRDVASALAFLHARRLLHRDLKTRNVRCTSDGRAKLIDFGVLATMGVAGEIAGTPPSIPPEAVRGLPLDGRADLFGLGALMYRVLSGRHAFPARLVKELETLWLERPPSLTSDHPDIPPALDELIMSLLSIDAAARPSSAAEVIDRLDAIVGVQPDRDVDLVRGWLSSAALVGRADEMAQLRGVMRDVMRGRGDVLVIESPSGVGKTRLLREVGLEGQLAGATVLRVRATGESPRPYAVMRQLVNQLVAVSPREALRTVGPHAAVLGRLLPDLARSAGVARERRSLDPAEERLRVQSALLSWFADVSEARPLLLLVDDLQRCDEASAAALAALGHIASTHALAVIAAQRVGEPVRAEPAVLALRQAGAVLRLRGLGEAGVRELVTALFGDIPEQERLANWMSRLAGGNPMHCIELARHLVDEKIVRYAEGMWLVAAELPSGNLPQGLAETFDRRIAELSPAARALGEALALVSSRASLEVCTAMIVDHTEAEVFRAMDELVLEDLLLGHDEGLELRHDSVREAFLRGLGAERRRRLHLRAAEVLSTLSDAEADRLTEIGWHFLHAGEDLRAARLLERAGLRLFHAQSFADAIGPLRAALEVYERLGASRQRRLELRYALMRSGVICDREVIMALADQTIDAYYDDAGLAVANAWTRYAGARLGLLFGTTWAWLRWSFRRRHRTRPNVALARLAALVNYVASVHCLTFATDRLQPLIDMVRPLAVLRDRIPAAALMLVENFAFIALGRFDELRRNCAEVLRILEADRTTPLSEVDRQLATGAAHYMLATAQALDQDPALDRSVEALRGLGLHFFELAAEMARVFYYRLRGEEHLASELRRRNQIKFVQLGNAWTYESQLSWISGVGYGLCRDVLGLKRTLDELARWSEAGYRFEGHARLLKGEYLRHRGDPVGARIALERALQDVAADDILLRQLTVAALIDALHEEGRYDEVLRVADEFFAGLGTDSIMESVRIRIERTLALAEAELRGPEVALQRLARLAEDERCKSSPVLFGLVEEARARVCKKVGDLDGFKQHAERAEAAYASTANPVLIARSRRLIEAELDSIGEMTGGAGAADDDTLALGAHDSSMPEVAQTQTHLEDDSEDTAIVDETEL